MGSRSAFAAVVLVGSFLLVHGGAEAGRVQLRRTSAPRSVRGSKGRSGRAKLSNAARRKGKWRAQATSGRRSRAHGATRIKALSGFGGLARDLVKRLRARSIESGRHRSLAKRFRRFKGRLPRVRSIPKR